MSLVPNGESIWGLTSKNGSRSEVEAWLLEVIVWNLIPLDFKYSCHRKHAGLNEAFPDSASSSVDQMNSACPFPLCAFCIFTGNSLEGYVRSGNASNIRFTGAGSAKRVDQLKECRACDSSMRCVVGGFVFPFASLGGIFKPFWETIRSSLMVLRELGWAMAGNVEKFWMSAFKGDHFLVRAFLRARLIFSLAFGYLLNCWSLIKCTLREHNE